VIWRFKEDVAIYKECGYLLIIKVKLIEIILDDVKTFDIHLTMIYKHWSDDMLYFSKLKPQLYTDVQEYGFDNFQVYRHCEVCNELFLKTSKNKTICSSKCRTRKSRDKK